MGNSTSQARASGDASPAASAPPAVAGPSSDVDPSLAAKGARLYVFDTAANEWTLHRNLVTVTFVNAADDGEGDDEGAPAWHLEVRLCESDARRTPLLPLPPLPP